MPEYLRRSKCPVHKEKLFLICGPCRYVCDDCLEAGWVSTAGTGGGDHLYNEQLNVKIVRGERLPYRRGHQNK